MTEDYPESRARGDQMTTEFFDNVLSKYLEEDRLESGVLRLELDDGKTRRIVVDDDTESLDTHEYLKREIEEVMHLIEANEDLLDQPVELAIPVGDAERVVEEAEEDGAVTTWFQPEGIKTVLDHLRVMVETGEQPAEDDAAE